MSDSEELSADLTLDFLRDFNVIDTSYHSTIHITYGLKEYYSNCVKQIKTMLESQDLAYTNEEQICDKFYDSQAKYRSYLSLLRRWTHEIIKESYRVIEPLFSIVIDHYKIKKLRTRSIKECQVCLKPFTELSIILEYSKGHYIHHMCIGCDGPIESHKSMFFDRKYDSFIWILTVLAANYEILPENLLDKLLSRLLKEFTKCYERLTNHYSKADDFILMNYDPDQRIFHGVNKNLIPFRMCTSELLRKHQNYFIDFFTSYEICDCAICYGPQERTLTFTFPCNHKFHLSCILDWFKLRLSCPLCRYNFKV